MRLISTLDRELEAFFGNRISKNFFYLFCSYLIWFTSPQVMDFSGYRLGGILVHIETDYDGLMRRRISLAILILTFLFVFYGRSHFVDQLIKCVYYTIYLMLYLIVVIDLMEIVMLPISGPAMDMGRFGLWRVNDISEIPDYLFRYILGMYGPFFLIAHVVIWFRTYRLIGKS